MLRVTRDLTTSKAAPNGLGGGAAQR